MPPAARELVLARHGEGRCNAAGVIGGENGCRGLSDRGREQSARLADRLAALSGELPFDVLVCTPRLRVRQSATVIGARLGLPVTVSKQLRGQEFGAADGQPWEGVTNGFGGPPAHDPDRPIAPGAETWNRYADRVLAAIRALLTAHPGRRVVVVAHGKTAGLAGALLSGATDPRAGATDYVIDHAALSLWRRRPDGWNLVLHNDSSHLIRADGGGAAVSG